MTGAPEGWARPGEGYAFVAIQACRGCGRSIAWWLTPRERRSPHDADGTSHFATCPDAASFRRTRPSGSEVGG